jgi:hypothetical protein
MADKAELELGSKEKVAYSLLGDIVYQEQNNKDVYLKPDARTYYLTLYRQCVRAGLLGLELDTSSHKGAK